MPLVAGVDCSTQATTVVVVDADDGTVLDPVDPDTATLERHRAARARLLATGAGQI